jgi:hypothetical protein
MLLPTFMSNMSHTMDAITISFNLHIDIRSEMDYHNNKFKWDLWIILMKENIQ